MKRFLFFLFLSWASCGFSWANEIRGELPIGTEFSIKTDFWVYEIKGWLSPVKDSRYVMNSDRGSGLGDSRFRYRATFPAGTRFKIVSLVKKSKQEWIYTVKTKGYTDPKIGDSNVSIFPLSMLEEPWRRRVRFATQPIKTIRLDPDLFTDFSYPDK